MTACTLHVSQNSKTAHKPTPDHVFGKCLLILFLTAPFQKICTKVIVKHPTLHKVCYKFAK